MDARIVVESAEAIASVAMVEVRVSIKVADLVRKLRDQFNPATVLAPLLHMGNSVTAVAPDYISRGGVSGWALA